MSPMQTNAPIKLLPSALSHRASHTVQSLLSRFAETSPEQDDDAFCPYFRGIPSFEKPVTNHISARSLISTNDISEWQTPYMPLLTQRQLELTLLEICRRQKQDGRKAERDASNALPSALTAAKTKREASILVPLCTVNNTPSILFTRRSRSLSSHASQISFPGGYFDQSLDINTSQDTSYFNILGNADVRLVNTAVREMQEELCFDMQQLRERSLQQIPFISILGQTQPVPSMAGKKVTPIIGQINYDLPHFSSKEFKQLFPGNAHELDWIFTIPIKQLLEEETSEPLKKWGDHDLVKTKGKYEYWGPVFPVPNVEEKRDDDRIWGLTASVLRPLLHRVFEPVFFDKDSASRL